MSKTQIYNETVKLMRLAKERFQRMFPEGKASIINNCLILALGTYTKTFKFEYNPNKNIVEITY